MADAQNPNALVQKRPWRHSIHLGDGVYTPGKRSYAHLQNKLAMMDLPEDLHGSSLLDVGCNVGFFSIEAHGRGASRVLAVDNQQRENVAAKFNLVKSIWAHNVDFRFWDVEAPSAADIGAFDIVLFLSVFHHLRYPFLGLDKVASVTSKMAVMEFVVAETTSGDDSAHLLRGFGRKGKIRLFPNKRLLLEMLQWAGFRDVEILGAHSRRTYDGIPAPAEKLRLKAYKEPLNNSPEARHSRRLKPVIPAP